MQAPLTDRLAVGPPGREHTVDDGLLARMMRRIIPIEFSVDTVDSTFKLNQNRSDSARARAAAALAAGGTPGMETPDLAARMYKAARETVND